MGVDNPYESDAEEYYSFPGRPHGFDDRNREGNRDGGMRE